VADLCLGGPSPRGAQRSGAFVARLEQAKDQERAVLGFAAVEGQVLWMDGQDKPNTIIEIEAEKMLCLRPLVTSTCSAVSSPP
jgi:hypothetical protein